MSQNPAGDPLPAAIRARLKFETAYGIAHIRRGRARTEEPPYIPLAWPESPVEPEPESPAIPEPPPVAESPAIAKPPAEPPAEPQPKPPAKPHSELPIAADGERVREVEAALAALNARVKACEKCAVLVKYRTQTVFSDGWPLSPLVFVGEAPGEDEDRTGVPFVGAAGKKLTEIIEKGFGRAFANLLGLDRPMILPRHRVYICNVLKCRPPGNRNPQPDEVENCRDFLREQLAIVKPKIICALGLPALRRLTNVDSTMGRARGKKFKFIDDPDITVIPTYHPSYLLRSYTDDNRRKVMDDITQVAKVLVDADLVPWWEPAESP